MQESIVRKCRDFLFTSVGTRACLTEIKVKSSNHITSRFDVSLTNTHTTTPYRIHNKILLKVPSALSHNTNFCN